VEVDLSNNRASTLLDAGRLPVEELASLAVREGWRPQPTYQAHRWFARRFGSAFRALLTGAALPSNANFWQPFYEGVDLRGCILLDPFVGGGTSVVEAMRLGADVIGVDVDAVACAVTRFETRAHTIQELLPSLEYLKCQVGEQLAPYYQTVTPEGDPCEVLHYFWVQVVECRGCGRWVEAHPDHQLAYEAEGSRQWVFCPGCHQVQELDRGQVELCCQDCGTAVPIQLGPIRYGRLTCPDCQTRERLIEVAARTGRLPDWRLFALEILERAGGNQRVPIAQRHFQPATARDQDIFETAKQQLIRQYDANEVLKWVPDRSIPRTGRVDDRLLQYGYTHYRELFNARQQLHLSTLAQAIHELEAPVREGMVIAFSDHLTTNCMMTYYAAGWRRLAPLFSIRAYRHVPRPVEVNPWLDGVGRGTFPNAVRQVQRAIKFSRAPTVPLITGSFRPVPTMCSEAKDTPNSRILHRNARDLSVIADSTVDMVLTDPPYLDNIAYSELSDFFLPWLQLFGMAAPDGDGVSGFRDSLAAKSRDPEAINKFQRGLRDCFYEIARVLTPEGRLIFTFQHRESEAWHALASALVGVGLAPIQVLPLRGDSSAGLHQHNGSIRWDAVFVMIKRTLVNDPDLILPEPVFCRVKEHWTGWTKRLAPSYVFRPPDQQNFYRACLVAGALGLFAQGESTNNGRPLRLALDDSPPTLTPP
jgi:putative DNA methylase